MTVRHCTSITEYDIEDRDWLFHEELVSVTFLRGIARSGVKDSDWVSHDEFMGVTFLRGTARSGIEDWVWVFHEESVGVRSCGVLHGLALNSGTGCFMRSLWVGHACGAQ